MDTSNPRITYCRGSTDFFENIISDSDRSAGKVCIQTVLYVLSLVYNTVIHIRLQLYKSGIFRSRNLGVPVVSIGNLTTGGTGKTPFAVLCANYFRQQGWKVSIISRGYHRKNNQAVKVVSDGKTLFLDPVSAGDEPFLMAKKCPGVSVVVGKDRYLAGLESVRIHSPDLIILDDGFQHLSLDRNIDIVLVDAKNPFSNNYLIPRGHMREPISHLSRATHAIIINKLPGVLSDDTDMIPSIKIDGVLGYVPEFLVDINLEHAGSLDDLKSRRAIVFCGVANPQPFIEWLLVYGVEIQECFVFDDHHTYTKKDLEMLVSAKQRWNADLLLTTEKDIVKMAGFERDTGILGVSMRFTGQDTGTIPGLLDRITRTITGEIP